MKRMLLALCAGLLVCLGLGGCATREEREAKDRNLTPEQRSHKRVFYSGWLLPEVSEEDKDFYYRSWLRR